MHAEKYITTLASGCFLGMSIFWSVNIYWNWNGSRTIEIAGMCGWLMKHWREFGFFTEVLAVHNALLGGNSCRGKADAYE